MTVSGCNAYFGFYYYYFFNGKKYSDLCCKKTFSRKQVF